MKGFEKLLSVAVAEDKLPLIGSGYFANEIFALQDYRKLIGFMMAAERLMADGDGEKAGETESFVVAGRFQVAPQRLRSHVDTKHGLGLGPNLDHRLARRCFRQIARRDSGSAGIALNRPILNLSFSSNCSW